MMETCGCCFDPIFGPMGALVGGNIIYCPQHSSANVMYEALERCRNTLTVMNAITPNYHLEGALQEVLGAIDLDDQFGVKTDKVDNVTPDRMLTAELQPIQPARPKLLPQADFSVGLPGSQSFCKVALAIRYRLMGHDLTFTL